MSGVSTKAVGKAADRSVGAEGDPAPVEYKWTEVGLIPKEWEVRRLGQLGRVVRGSSPRPAGDPRFFNGSFIPWLTVAALTNVPESCLHVSETGSQLTEEGAKRSRVLSPNTLIVSNSGATLGVAKILDMKCCANDGIAALIEQRAGNKAFLCHYVNTKTTRLREVVATGNGQPNLNTALIRDIAVPFPPPSEQIAIAEALSDVDRLIRALEALIGKKRGIKQGAMQQLLTGQTRLPKFSGEWPTKPLGEVVRIEKGQLITEATLRPGSVPVIAGGRQPAYFHNEANRTGKTITVSGSGANAGFVGFWDRPIFASDCSTISEGLTFCLEFVFYQLILQQEAIYRAQTGGAQPHIHPNDLRPLAIGLPALEEQQAIANVLSDMDAEIAALEKRRDKTHALKQGMMQQLLTGGVRLVNPRNLAAIG